MNSRLNSYLFGDISSFRYGKLPKKELISSNGVYPIYTGYKYSDFYPEFNCEANQIIVVARGVGGTGDVKLTKKKCWLTNLSIECLISEEYVDKLFLYYYFLRENLRYLDSGSAQSQITIDDLRKVELLLPPISEQRAITGILGALDDKIELNRRMNRTLESMARAVFRQWFVYDEQVKKWDALAWGDIATLEYGKSLSDYKDSDGPYTVYGTNGPIGRHTEALYPSEGIIIGRKGAYRGIHYSPNPFFVIDTAFYLKPQRPLSMKWAYYELLQFDLNGMDSGSAIPSTSRPDFYNIPVLFPPQELMNSFEDFVAPLFTKIYANEKESRTLASLRDSLLPKLMRGEVRVKDVEDNNA